MRVIACGIIGLVLRFRNVGGKLGFRDGMSFELCGEKDLEHHFKHGHGVEFEFGEIFAWHTRRLVTCRYIDRTILIDS